ncbi:MAG: hypothetical protein ROY99_14060 [Ignavibacterium sp.]|jgi:hypothetical protein|nr:hypothetical protein [Ignavibacterium sp.]
MIRKIKIFSLLFLFVISTAGLPITITLCKMAVSEREQCTMHNAPVSSSCCSNQTAEQEPSITFDQSSCCQTKFVYKKVEDQYLTNKTSLDPSANENILHSVEILHLPVELSNSLCFHNNSSPPFLIHHDLYITNSILLI